MTREEIAPASPQPQNDGRGLSQIVFVLIGLGIIAAGLWTLYMGDAPYHPADQVSQDTVIRVDG